MRSLWQESARREMLARIDRLKATSQPNWGRMNAPQMVEHLANALKMAFGDLPCRMKNTPLRFFPLKQLALYVIPHPKGLPTARELLAPPSGDWDASVAMLRGLIERFATESRERQWPLHPAFGELGARRWGVLAHKHMDHHLRQFGV
jgi:hypothetical protein